MPNTGKKTQGEKKMTRAATAKRAAAKRAEQPLLGEAALKEALAGFGVKTDAAPASATAHAAQAASGNAKLPAHIRNPGPKRCRRCSADHLADDAKPAPQGDSARRSRMACHAGDPAETVP